MPCVSTSIDIDAPPEDVWSVLMDPRRLGDWVTIQCDIQDVPEGELSDGDSFRQTLALAGAKFEVRWTVREIDEPRIAEWSAEGPKGSGARVQYELEPNDGATRFRYRNDFNLPGGGVGKVAGKLSSRVAGRAMRTSLRRFREVVENPG